MRKTSPEPTIQDIAREANVSRTTVSRVLNASPNVAPETRTRVVAVLRRLDYRVNVAARSLRTTKTRLVGLLVPAISNDFFGRIAEVLEETLRRDGIGLLIASSGWEAAGERVALESLRARRVDALVLSLVDDRAPATAALLAEAGGPIVLLDREVRGVLADRVVTDHRSAVSEAVEHLASLGHEVIGIATVTPGVRTGREGRAGFRATIAALGLRSAGEIVVPFDAITRQSGWRIVDELLSAGATAILAGTPLTVNVGILEHLASRGLRIPDDVSLVLTDDSDFASVFSPPLTLITRSLDDVAYRVARMVTSRLIDPNLEPRVELVPMQLVVRASTAAPKAQLEGSAR